MDGDDDPAETRSSSYRRTVGACLILLALVAVSFSLDTRWWVPADGDVFIGNADQASVADAARSISEGNGPQVRNLWLSLDDPGFDVTFPHVEPYWATYPAYVMAPFFRVVDEARKSLLASASLMKMIAAMSVGWTVHLLTRRRVLALAAAAVMLFEPAVLQRVNGMADIYFTAGVAATVALYATAHARQSWRWYVAAGIATGLTAGFRPPLGFIAVVPPLALAALALARRDRDLAARHGSVVLIAGLVVVPWIVTNLNAFGSPLPPGYKQLTEITSVEYATGNHDLAFYDPSSTSGEQVALVDLDRAVAYVGDFAGGLFSGGVMPLWLIALALVAISYRVLARERRWTDLGPAPPDLRRFIGGLLVFWSVVGVGFAAQHHYEPRYWLFLIPLAIVAGFGFAPPVVTTSQIILPAIGAFSICLGLLHYGMWPGWPTVPDDLDVVEDIVGEDEVILTPEPWQMAFHTEINSVMLPFTTDLELISDIAAEYDAEYVVVVNGQTRHPGQRRWFRGHLPPIFEPVVDEPGLFIGRIVA